MFVCFPFPVSLLCHHLFLNGTYSAVSFSCFSSRHTINSEVNLPIKICTCVSTPWTCTYTQGRITKGKWLLLPNQLTKRCSNQTGIPVLGWLYYFSDSAATDNSSQFSFICTSVCFAVHISQPPALPHTELSPSQ